MIIKVTYNVTDVYMSTSVSPIYIKLSYGGGGITEVAWGDITGTLSDQTDLQSELDAKYDTPTGTTAQYVRGDGSLATFPTTFEASDVIIEVRNNTGSTLARGSVVYVNGAVGNKMTVAKAIATTDGLSAQTLGVLQDDIANNAQGNVVVIGEVANLDTSAFAEGTQLYLSGTVAGGYTSTKPYAPLHLVYVGIVTRQHPSLGTISVKIQNGYELEELHNVDALNPNNNDGIFYNSTSQLWEHKSIATVLGYTPQAALTLTTSGSSGAATLVGATLNIPQYTGGSGSVTSVDLTAGTGISVSGGPITTSGSITVTNTAPDQMVSLTGAGTTTTSGTYPNFTITSNDQYTGTVTSVGLTSSTSGVTITGSPVTSSGSLNFEIATASGSATGLLSSTDWTTFNSKQNALTNPITGTGTSGQVSYWSGTNTQTGSNDLFWDSANGRLGVNTNSPGVTMEIKSSNAPTFSVSSTTDTQSSNGRAGFRLIRQGTGNFTGWDFIKDANDHLSIRKLSGGSANENFKLFTSGNILIQNGGTFTDGGQRLQVNGDTLITGVISIGSGQFIRQSGMTAGGFRYTSNNIVFLNSSNNAFATFPTGSTSTVSDIISITTTKIVANLSLSHTSSSVEGITATYSFAPTSGTGTLTNLLLNPTINQTGGANGITRGLYVNPTLTAAADWRAIEAVSASNANHTLIKLRNATVDVFTVKSDSKIGFFNATPVAQATTGIAEATFVENSGGTAVNVDSTFAGYTLQQIAQALKDFGLLA